MHGNLVPLSFIELGNRLVYRMTQALHLDILHLWHYHFQLPRLGPQSKLVQGDIGKAKPFHNRLQGAEVLRNGLYGMNVTLVTLFRQVYGHDTNVGANVENGTINRELIQEKETQMDQLLNYFHYRDLNDNLFCNTRGQFRLREPEKKEMISAWFKHGDLQDIEQAQTFEAKRLYLTAWGQYHLLMGEDHSSYLMHKKIARHWEDHEEHIKENTKGYNVALANYLNLCHMVKAYNEFPDALEKIKSYPPENIEQEGEDFQNLAQLEFLYCINTGQFTRAKSFIVTYIQPGLKKFPEKISPARHMSICHSIALLYMVTEDYKNAKLWADRMIERGKNEHRHDLQRFHRVLEVLLAFEMSATEGLSEERFRVYMVSLQKSAERWLSLNGGIMEYERGFLRLFVRLVGKTKDQKQKLYQDLASDLEKISPEEGQQFGQRIDELKIWLSSKLNQKRMEEIMMDQIRAAGVKR